MFIFMYVSITMSTLCIYDFFFFFFLEGPMADERKLNGSPSINKEYYYYYYKGLRHTSPFALILINITD